MKTFIFTAFLLILVFTGCQTNASSSSTESESANCNCSLSDVMFPYQKIDEFDDIKFKEPSGIVYHPQLDTLFIVGDKGDLTQIKTDGSLVRQEKLMKGANLEGITVNPATGLLYIAFEGHDRILEVDPNTFAVQREITLDRMFEGAELIKPGAGGLEGITFVPGSTPDDEGTFYLVNQSDDLAGNDPSIIIEAALSDSGDDVAHIVRYFSIGVVDMSGMYYQPDTGQLLVISDTNNLLLHVNRAGEIVQAFALPGQDQEAITFDNNGFLYIGEDSGDVLKYQQAASKEQ